MKRQTKGKVNGEPFKLPVSGGSREGQDEEGNDGKVTGSQSSFRSVEETGRNHTILLIRHQNFNRELHGKRRRRGESESEGNWKE